MDLQLKGKKAFISGSTQGIGLAIAKQLLQEEADVIINGRNVDSVNNVVELLKSEFPNGNISGIATDFSQKNEVINLLEQLDNIDILINNVGIFGLQDFFQMKEEEWDQYFGINLKSGMLLSQKLLPKMLAKNFGRIIFISSESGVNVPENMIAYGASKAAMNALSNGLSKLTKGTNVTVNTVLGGPTYSDGVAQTIEQIATVQNVEVAQLKAGIIQQTNPHILLQRFIEPKEIASLVTYLSSPISVATNGASLRADSGVLKVI